MLARTVHFDGADPMEAHARVAAAIDSTPHDAVVHLRVTGVVPPSLASAALRAMAGARTVTVPGPTQRPSHVRGPAEVTNCLPESLSPAVDRRDTQLNLLFGA
jgi:hypothetical protein